MRKARTEQENLEFLEQLVHQDMKDAARHFKISESAARSWLYRLRKQIVTQQIYLNRIRSLQKMSPRVRKFTTMGSIPEIDEDTGQETYPELRA